MLLLSAGYQKKLPSTFYSVERGVTSELGGAEEYLRDIPVSYSDDDLEFWKDGCNVIICAPG